MGESESKSGLGLYPFGIGLKRCGLGLWFHGLGLGLHPGGLGLTLSPGESSEKCTKYTYEKEKNVHNHDHTMCVCTIFMVSKHHKHDKIGKKGMKLT